MLSAANIQKMKQNNVSVNKELTMQRTKDTLTRANDNQQSDIERLSGVKRASVKRVESTGSISAKLAVAVAQTLGTNPFYLTGESDNPNEYSDEVLEKFVLDKGYPDIVKNGNKAKSKPAKPKEQSANTISINMSEEDAVLLLRSLYARVQYDGGLLDKLRQIQKLLV